MKLEPCPECGRQPSGRVNASKFYLVTCINDGCPSTFQAEHKFKLIAENRWNAYAASHPNQVKGLR